ncbi:MAG TPA: aldehyde ferredoxin oxidoreductase family protein [Firmicutes bacterium]|nr:aldehyde ferredoxin oxidoreductase family protein [Bacillota bacterium]
MNGYHGRILEVDLGTGETSTTTFDEDFARKYIGGVGFGMKLLQERLVPCQDAFNPAIPVIFTTGPLATTPVPGGSRYVVVTKSPLTGLFGDTDIGGSFGAQLKGTGFDAVVITGKAESPKYLWITDDGLEIRDAAHLWGLETAETERRIMAELGDPGARIAAVGPAGENRVLYASIESEMRFFGGRLGVGAVIAAKNIKAIAVRGRRRPGIANREALLKLLKEVNHAIVHDGSCSTLSQYGTWNTCAPASLNGVLPVRNFQTTGFDRIDRIDGDALLRTIYAGKRTCPGCLIGCRRVVKGNQEYPVSEEFGGPQYETVASLGPLLDNDDPFVIAKAGERCNLLGMDTISTGVSIAFAMECYERGILQESDVGYPLRWGDPQAILRLIEQIARREGLGAILADGVKRASAMIGKGSEEWAMHVKGLEVPMHDPRGKKGMGLAYATACKGADHESSMHDEAFQRDGAMPEFGFTRGIPRQSIQGKPRLVRVLQDYWGVLADALPICKFPLIPPRPFTPERVLSTLNFVTGWDMDLDEYLMAGERIFNLWRCLNIREGKHALEDTLPSRFETPLESGGSAGQSYPRETLTQALQEYYRLRGWSPQGIPTLETLKRLGLEFMSDSIMSKPTSDPAAPKAGS